MSADKPNETAEGLRNLGRRLAAAGALAVALISLLQHAPLWLASLRGLATLSVLALGTRLGAGALARAIAYDRARVQPKEEVRS
jgi:hypothetical protein